MNGKVAIITGASSGIGLACANEFASRGASVVLAARNEQKLKEIESTLTGKGYSVFIVKTDVTIQEDCENLIALTLQEFGRIDYLLNNAGISMRALFSTVDLKVIRQIMEVNFFGAVYCTKYALPHIIKTKGSIVGITSIAGFFGLPARTGYSASKFALQGFLETIRVENFRNGVHVLIAAPGFTATNIRKSALTANGSQQGASPRNESKMMSSEEVARRIARGIIRRQRRIIMSVQGKLVVAARRILPVIVDKMLFYYMGKEPDANFGIESNPLLIATWNSRNKEQ